MSLLFLSHSGADVTAARALKSRIIQAGSGDLDVWLDVDQLEGGRPWQRQIEDAIARASAFAVYVGTFGIVNWVEAEVRIAIERAIADPSFRFIPILATAAPDPRALPGFVRLFQCIQEAQVERVVATALDRTASASQTLELEPFFGLSPIDEHRSHLFFGREDETNNLVMRVFDQPLVLVSGESGSGKSSLVRAGLIPKFRGGALALVSGTRPTDQVRHVVITRPRSHPWAELGNAVEDAASRLGLPLADRGTLSDWARSGDLEQARRALRCGLQPQSAQVLLVVDQFEELFTTTAHDEREEFLGFLLALADPADDRFKIVATIRHDYVNLCNSVAPLRERLDANNRHARFVLGPISSMGLEKIVTEPLRLAGIAPRECKLLADTIRSEVGSRAGDLALVQMALTETWHARMEHGGDLVSAYVAVGRVEGALAKAAEDIRQQLSTAAVASLAPFLEDVLVRLVRLGDTGGATRRLAARDEFDDKRWELVQFLSSREGKRLLLLRGGGDRPAAEIAHEALVTAWPYLQNLLQAAADDVRVLERLTGKALDWQTAAPARRREQLAPPIDLELFSAMAGRRAGWLSKTERQFLEESRADADRRTRRESRIRSAAWGAVVVLTALLGLVGWQYLRTARLLVRVNASIADSIWSRMDFALGEVEPADVNALWELRLASPAVVQASWDGLFVDAARLLHLGLRPEPILTAHRLRWETADTGRLYTSLLAAAKGTTGLDVDRISAGLNAVVQRMNATQSKASALALLGAIPGVQAAEVGLDQPLTQLVRQVRPEDSEELLKAFLEAMGRDPKVKSQLTLEPALAALVDRFPEPARVSALTTTWDALIKATDWSDVLSNAASALAKTLPATEARSVLSRLVAGLSAPLSARDARLRAQVIGAFRPVLSASDFGEPARAVAALLTQTTSISDIEQIGNALAHLDTPLEATQAEEVAARLVEEIDTISGTDLVRRARAMGSLPGLVSPDRVNAVLTALVNQAANDPTRYSGELAQGLRSLAPKLNDEQTTRAVQSITDTLGRLTSNYQRQDLARALAALAGTTTSDVAPASFNWVLTVAAERASPDEELLAAIKTIANRMTIERRGVAFSRVVSALKDQTDAATVRDYALALPILLDCLDTSAVLAAMVQLLELEPASARDEIGVGKRDALLAGARRLPNTVVDSAFDALLASVGQARSSTELRWSSAATDALDVVSPALMALIPRLTDDHRERASRQLLRSVPDADEASTAFRLARLVSLLRGRPEPELMRAAVGKVLDSLRAATGEKTQRLDAAADASPSLGFGSRTQDLNAAVDASSSLAFFAEFLTPEEAREGTALTLKSLELASGNEANAFDSAVFKQLTDLCAALKALGAHAPDDQKTTIASAMESLLAWSTDHSVLAAAADLIPLVSPAASPAFVERLIGWMKYPTAAGEPTLKLLTALKQRIPESPGAEAGLAENLRWIAATYPSLSLTSPPTCPKPLSSLNRCPAAP